MKAVFFDFDDTLTHGDTLPLWLAELRGWPWTAAAYAVAASLGAFIPARGVSDRRGRIKSLLLKLTVRGIAADRAAQAGTALRNKVRWRSETVDALRRHHGEGARIVVVTGAATVYLPALLAGLPVDEVLGTELEVVGNRLTGRIAGVNCVRAAKAARVGEWLDAHRPSETWGYGNAPHDLPMLALLDYATVI